jgi:hypothetical protein
VKRWLGIALLVALGACAHFGARHAAAPDRIKIPHSRHVAAKVDCIACHENVYDATDLLAPNLRPDEAKCLECHKEEKQKQNCGFCHTDVARATAWAKPEPTLKMSHKSHIELTKEDCRRCHNQLPEPFAEIAHVPAMATCTSCHEHAREYAAARCITCHPSLARFPLRPVTDFSHQGDFLHGHATSARSSAEACAQCHDQTYCAECHARTVSNPIEVKYPERVLAQFIHRADFVGRHSIEATADPMACRRCHGTSFCDSCHQAEGLTPAAANPRDPHPRGWSFPGSADFHGDAAGATSRAVPRATTRGRGRTASPATASVGSAATRIRRRSRNATAATKSAAMRCAGIVTFRAGRLLDE